MLTEPQERWLKALESGDYKQGRFYLHTIEGVGGDHFCCLGVACHIFKDELGLTNERKSNIERYNGESEQVPDEVRVHLGLWDNYGSPSDGIISENLINLNDERMLTFKKIARTLRNNPERYFK